MKMMKESMDRLTRVTSKMPRHLYFTIKRFFSLVISMTVGAIAILLIWKSMDWSQALFGTPIPAFLSIAVGAMGVASYYMAKIDVDIEKREQERTLRELERE